MIISASYTFELQLADLECFSENVLIFPRNQPSTPFNIQIVRTTNNPFS